MGQFGNQPDFGTRALTLSPTGDSNNLSTGYFINPPCALYVGTGGDLYVTVVGGDENSGYTSNQTLFKNVPNGTFMPIIVSYIWSTFETVPLTTASDIVGIY
jgi:hypothetical protein